MKKIGFANASRKHRVGRAHIRYVMTTVEPVAMTTNRGDSGWLYVGTDDRGVALEIIAVEVDSEELFVIHAMPRVYRRRD